MMTPRRSVCLVMSASWPPRNPRPRAITMKVTDRSASWRNPMSSAKKKTSASRRLYSGAWPSRSRVSCIRSFHVGSIDLDHHLTNQDLELPLGIDLLDQTIFARQHAAHDADPVVLVQAL